VKRLSISIVLTLAVLSGVHAAVGPLNLSQAPLFIATAARPNVLLVLANSNSMDEDASGLAVGSAKPTSKSEIARGVAKTLVSNYTNTLNMGLMAFQQLTTGGDPVRLYQVHSSPYDVSFDPANYDPTYTGPRTGPKRRGRAPNVSSPGEFIYYNVNLPFYDAANQGSAFCYSRTAHAFNNGENPVGGPWDGYSCFRTKTGPSDVVPANGGQEAVNGWSNFLFGTAFLPTDSDLGQGITDFGSFLAWNWVSPAWFSNGSPGRGYVHVPIAFLDATQAAKFNTKLGTSQFAVNGPQNPALPLQNAGLTPLEGTLLTARDYFAGTLSNAAEGGPLAAPPNSCNKNYVVVVTNGLPSVKRDGTPSSDVVAMLADATAAAASLATQGVDTYIVGFALPFGVNPAQLDTIAAAGGTGTAYNAANQADLVAALDQVFADILRRSGAASAVALNSSSVSANNWLYQAKFDIGWAGRLLAYALDPVTGALAGSPTWDAATVLDTLNFDTDRRIITYKPSTRAGVPFRWPTDPTMPTVTELDVTQTTALNTSPSGFADTRGADRLNYLRGDNSLEGPNPVTQFRPRNSDLGDIVDSSPFYVGLPIGTYRDPSYRGFRLSAAMTSREPMIYVGANDGFLHGFRASDGREMLAYLPSTVYANLTKLTGQAYVHRYFVDGSANVADAQIGAGSTWRTTLVSGLGAGGRGVFALDVTDPSVFSEANASQIAMWEFNSTDPTDGADLGYTFGRPVIVKLNDGEWAAIIGNGYNNTGSGQSGIFILNLKTGAVIRKILTGVGSVGTPNGIGAVVAVDTDGNDTADVVYAGDLTGRLWKFDLSDSNPANWVVAYGGTELFHARQGGNDQPITTAPEVTLHPISGYFLNFATGQYIDVNDPTSTGTQTLYGVWDKGDSGLTRFNLVQQTVTGVVSYAGTDYRTVSSNVVDWASKYGWRMDLPTSGERVAVDPVLRDGRIVYTTLIPDSSPCSAGGTGWLMELDFKSGAQLTQATLDTNGDGKVDSSDALVGGVAMSVISSSPVVQTGYGTEADPLENKYLNQSSGNVARVLESSSRLGNRRVSWREVQ
jgi:type IV pilus assembly protein PilY1